MPVRRKRERGVAVAPLLSEVGVASTSETTLDTTLRISETTGGNSDGVGVAVRLSITDARLSTTEGSATTPVGRVALPVGRLPLRPVGAASERHVAATIGTVSTL